MRGTVVAMSSDEDEVQDEQRVLRGISEELGRRQGRRDGARTSDDARRVGTSHQREAEEEVPPGPWHWQRVSSGASDLSNERTREEPQGEALVDAEGTWLVWAEGGVGFPDVNPDARELLAKAWVLEQLPDLFELWHACRYTETPVERGAAVATFDNAMGRLQSAYEEDAGTR